MRFEVSLDALRVSVPYPERGGSFVWVISRLHTANSFRLSDDAFELHALPHHHLGVPCGADGSPLPGEQAVHACHAALPADQLPIKDVSTRMESVAMWWVPWSRLAAGECSAEEGGFAADLELEQVSVGTTLQFGYFLVVATDSGRTVAMRAAAPMIGTHSAVKVTSCRLSTGAYSSCLLWDGWFAHMNPLVLFMRAASGADLSPSPLSDCNWCHALGADMVNTSTAVSIGGLRVLCVADADTPLERPSCAALCDVHHAVVEFEMRRDGVNLVRSARAGRVTLVPLRTCARRHGLRRHLWRCTSLWWPKSAEERTFGRQRLPRRACFAARAKPTGARC
jgi:hypothetical protein